MILGLSGSIGSGKDTVCDFLVEKGFVKFVFSDVIREELKKEGVQATRENLVKKGNELREKFGRNFIAQELVRRIKESGNENAVVSGVRNLGELEELRKQEEFYLIVTDAPLKERFERIASRREARDTVNFEEFKKKDEIDKGFGEKETGQQVGKVMQQADFTIINDKSLQELFEGTEKVLKKIKEKTCTKKQQATQKKSRKN